VNPRHKLSQKLDGFKRTSPHAPPKARTMGILAKIGLLYKSGRLLKALAIIFFVAWAAYDNIYKTGLELKDWLRWGEGTEVARNATYTVIVGGVVLSIALLLIVSGVRRNLRAVATIEYGTVTTAKVREVVQRSRVVNKIYFHRWVATCRFKDDAGQSVELEVIGPAEDTFEKGDPIAVVYDPGVPANAIAIAALPSFVKTAPVLDAQRQPASRSVTRPPRAHSSAKRSPQ
jgi:hypothetical protein